MEPVAPLCHPAYARPVSEWDPKWGPPPPPAEKGSFHVPAGLDVDRSAPSGAGRGSGRPPLVDAFALGMIASTLAGVATAPAKTQLAFGCTVVFSLGVIYFFWVGRNWARILVLLGSALSALGILVLFAPVEITHQIPIAQRVSLVANALFGVVMLVGLTRPSVRRYFDGRKKR